MAHTAGTFNRSLATWRRVERAVAPANDGKSTADIGKWQRLADRMDRVSDVVVARWPGLPEDTKAAIAEFVYDVLEPGTRLPRLLARLRYIASMIQDPDGMPALILATQRIVDVTLEAIERDDAALSGDLERAVQEAYEHPGPVLTRDNVREFVRSL